MALVVQHLLARLFEAIGLDELFERTGGSGNLYHLSYIGGPSRLLGLIVFWGILLAGVAGSLSVLGFASLEQTIDRSSTSPGGRWLHS